jgi:S1-C subfamily serine protease
MRTAGIALVAVAFSSVCYAQSPREIAQVSFKSVVLLEMNDQNGQPLSLGSGFFISSGTIATNAHVVEGAASGTAKLIGDTHKMQILGTVAIDRHADLALLRVNSSAPPLVLKSSTSPSVGDNVYVVGNPLGLEGTFSEGIISGIRRIDEDSVLQMTAPISPGSSGGPVMDSSGAVIGISVATFKNGQNLNLAVPAIYLSKLLALPSKDVVPLGVQKPNGQTTKSMLDDAGTRVEKGVTVSDYQLGTVERSYGSRDIGDLQQGEYQFRAKNELPVEISNLKYLILYHDTSGTLMDFEEETYKGNIPAGLTKTVITMGSGASAREAAYYGKAGIVPKVEIRVVSFDMNRSE